MELNRCLSASAEEEEGRREGGEDDINNAGNSIVHEDLDLLLLYFTCLHGRYLKAQVTLAAYLMCWLLLKLCKVRNFSTNM